MRLKLFVIFLIAILLSGIQQYKYDAYTDYMAEKNVFVTLPPGKTLKILSFGFPDLMADMLFIWSIQFYSSYNITNSYDYLEHIYNTITDLAPQYKDPYIVGSWIMALEAGKIEMAIRLLQKGARNMEDEWIFDYECATYAKRYLKEYKLAEVYYKKALGKKGAPPWLKRMMAHMVYMSDDLDRAREMWEAIYRNAKSKLEKNSSYKHLYQIKFEIDRKRLKKQVEQFKGKYGRYPAELASLVRERLLREVPKDFAGHDYVYHPKTGTISAINVLKWKK